MDSISYVQILNKAFSISLNANALYKGLNPSPLLTIGKQ